MENAVLMWYVQCSQFNENKNTIAIYALLDDCIDSRERCVILWKFTIVIVLNLPDSIRDEAFF